VFRLSKDLSQAEAEARIRQIESLWRESVAACRRPDDLHQNIDDQWGPVVWDESRLELARAIANPLRKKHARAVRKLESKLARMFLSCEDQFPADQPKITKDGGANITVAQIRRIRQLGAEGYKRKKIAEIVGVSTVTVWRHLGAKKKAK